MDQEMANYIMKKMKPTLNNNQLMTLKNTLDEIMRDERAETELTPREYLDKYIQSKRIEGLSESTLDMYRQNLNVMIETVDKKISAITTDDLRNYLVYYQKNRNVSMLTLENIRSYMSGFFGWLEAEGIIYRNPMEQIHGLRVQVKVKEPYTDEEVERMRDACTCIRDLAIVDMLNSTGMRIGELINLDISDVNMEERECIVLGKGNKERKVYFDAKAKLHLIKYLETRDDDNPALFVTSSGQHKRLGRRGIEMMLHDLGKISGVEDAHPHKFRRTMATCAIERGMPVEQVQKLLGHVRIDTTMKYAIVKQSGLKSAHRKYLG